MSSTGSFVFECPHFENGREAYLNAWGNFHKEVKMKQNTERCTTLNTQK